MEYSDVIVVHSRVVGLRRDCEVLGKHKLVLVGLQSPGTTNEETDCTTVSIVTKYMCTIIPLSPRRQQRLKELWLAVLFAGGGGGEVIPARTSLRILHALLF